MSTHEIDSKGRRKPLVLNLSDEASVTAPDGGRYLAFQQDARLAIIAIPRELTPDDVAELAPEAMQQAHAATIRAIDWQARS